MARGAAGTRSSDAGSFWGCVLALSDAGEWRRVRGFFILLLCLFTFFLRTQYLLCRVTVIKSRGLGSY